MKKLIALTAAIMVLASCGKKEEAKSTDSGKKVVTVWAWDKNFNVSIMEKAEKKYEATHPNVDIQVVDYAQSDIITKLNTGLSSGAKKGLPEIVLIEDYSAKKFITSYPGYFADLKESIDHSKFAGYKVEAMTDNDGIYGVPFDSGVTGFFYRKDLFEKAGFTKEDITNITWDKFIEIGKKVKAKTGVNMLSGDLLGDAGLIRIMMQSGGKWYFDKDGKVDIADNKALKEAVGIMKKIKEANIMTPTSGWGEWVGSMNSSKTASVVTGMWIMPSIKAAADQSGKWGITTIPKLSSVDSINASNLGGSSWYVLEKSPSKDAAVDFLNTLYAGDNDFYQQILLENGALGTYIPSQDGSAYNQADQFFGGKKVYKEFAEWMQEIPSVNYGSFVNEADSAVLNSLKLIVDGSVSIDEGLERAQEEVTAQIR